MVKFGFTEMRSRGHLASMLLQKIGKSPLMAHLIKRLFIHQQEFKCELYKYPHAKENACGSVSEGEAFVTILRSGM